MARNEEIRDHFAVAMMIAVRWYKPLLARFHDDVVQELHLLAWEAKTRNYIAFKRKGKRKRYGNGRKMCIKAYNRAVQARLYLMMKNYF